jgi:hypothetical protein
MVSILQWKFFNLPPLRKVFTGITTEMILVIGILQKKNLSGSL